MSYSQLNPAPDFGAFDSDSDDDSTPLSRAHSSTAPSTTASTRAPHTRSRDAHSDPLSAHSDSVVDERPTLLPRMIGIPAPRSSPTALSLPGSYDFEPQANEGRPPPPPLNASASSGNGASSVSSRRSSFTASVANGRTRPAANRGGRDVAGNTGADALRNGVASWGARFLPAGILDRLLPGAGVGAQENARAAGDDEGRLLFSRDGEGEHDDDEDEGGEHDSSYPPTNRGRGGTNPAAHVPLPPRPPSFLPPTSNTTSGRRVFGGGQGNDGVFANLSAKPDGVVRGSDFVGGEDGDKDDEVLPSYQAAAMDATPAYWETTVITPGGFLGPDDICVDGLPVGNFFGFAWNMLVSMSFQFVGFLLTYLLHTTHAAKNGSRAGLGITLIQLGFYIKQRVDHPELFLPPGDSTGLDGSPGPSPDDFNSASSSAPIDLHRGHWTWWGGAPPPSAEDLSSTSEMASSTLSALGAIPTQLHGALSSVWDSSDPDRMSMVTSAELPSLGDVGNHAGQMIRGGREANEWLAFLLVTVGSFLFIGGCLSYWRAVRWARAVQQNQQATQTDAEMIRVLVE